MAAIRSSDTKPEMIVRRGLHRLGFRYRLHEKCLPGKPDLVFPKHRAVLFVHGCFWHGHNCHLFKWPRTREEFWKKKIRENRQRDAIRTEALRSAGWRVGIVWECVLRGKYKLNERSVIETVAQWLGGGQTSLELSGLHLQEIEGSEV
ncbi:very short patch repair endonuclease [Ruegeria lacuscaerulensis]|nr:very short patch repair endonuclease [Ruegeria lacuscaerulensis]